MAVFVSYCPQFWGSRAIYKANDTQYMFERHDQKLIVFAFLAVSWAIAHSLGFPRWFTRPMTLSTCLGGMTENSSFLHLWTFLWAIAHYFGVLGQFIRNMTICTCFRELLSIVLGLWGDLQGPWHSVNVWEAWPKTHHFYVFEPFSIAIVHSFGFPGWFSRPMTLSTCLTRMTKNSIFLRLWPFSWAIAQYLGF
jgi:hypothetical protein